MKKQNKFIDKRFIRFISLGGEQLFRRGMASVEYGTVQIGSDCVLLCCCLLAVVGAEKCV